MGERIESYERSLDDRGERYQLMAMIPYHEALDAFMVAGWRGLSYRYHEVTRQGCYVATNGLRGKCYIVKDVTREQADAIENNRDKFESWNSGPFRDVVQRILGPDFGGDP
jgi:hypothetical protein